MTTDRTTIDHRFVGRPSFRVYHHGLCLREKNAQQSLHHGGKDVTLLLALDSQREMGLCHHSESCIDTKVFVSYDGGWTKCKACPC